MSIFSEMIPQIPGCQGAQWHLGRWNPGIITTCNIPRSVTILAPILSVISYHNCSHDVMNTKLQIQCLGYNLSIQQFIQHWNLRWQVSIGSGNGLLPSGNKPLPEPMLTHMTITMMTSPGHNELIQLSVDLTKHNISWYWVIQLWNYKAIMHIRLLTYGHHLTCLSGKLCRVYHDHPGENILRNHKTF